MILADTSVWIHHFRSYNSGIARLLEQDEVLIHDFVIGELASGNMKDRAVTLHRLQRLPSIKTARHSEVLHLLEFHKLHGTGLGWVDLHLLAAAKLSGSSIFTLDRSLMEAAKRLRIDVNS
ncbi:MAG: type II toxin-antitoxin system VapC family toxin [Bryobacteraceae bacterium]